LQPVRRGETLTTIAGLAAVIAFYLVRCRGLWHQVNDDAFITFRYSAFLGLGRGPYFNLGEHVEGYTNFLLMSVLAPVYRFAGEAAVPVVAKALGVAAGIGSLVLVALLVRRMLAGDSELGRFASPIGVGAAALVAVSPAYAINSTTGLATTIFGFCLTLGVYRTLLAYDRGAWCGAGFAFAAALLTRPEGVYVFAWVWLAWVAATVLPLRSEGFSRIAVAMRPAWIDAAIVVAVFGAQLVFRVLAYDGELLPNTYYAKAGGFWKISAWRYVFDGLLEPLMGWVGVVALGVGGFLAVRRRAGAGILFVGALAGASLPFITGTDWMLGWRLVMPHLPLAAAAVGVGGSVAIAAAMNRGHFLIPMAWCVAAVTLATIQQPLYEKFEKVTTLRADGYAEGHEDLAQWLCREGNAAAGDTIAIMDIGIVGYRCPEQRILDITGLTDRYIAKRPGSFLKKRYSPDYVLSQEPRFIVLTLTAEGWWKDPPPERVRFHFWSQAELRISKSVKFNERYVRRPNSPSAETEGWQAEIARRRGAVRIFEHAYPEAYYLLLVFDSEAGGASAAEGG